MIGSIINAVNNIKQGYWENAFNMVSAVNSIKSRQLQEKAFEWQKYYDQNQTQIRVDDMAKAGLNPILAAGGVGSSSVTAQSATPLNAHVSSGQLEGLAEALMHKQDMKQQKELADNANQTQKDVAETQAASDKYVADKNNETARINANLNAQTQTAIAAANNEALSGVRGAEERYNNSLSDKQEFENDFTRRYNELTGRLHSSKSVIEFLDNGTTSVAAWLGMSVEKASDFIKWAKNKAKESLKK